MHPSNRSARADFANIKGTTIAGRERSASRLRLRLMITAVGARRQTVTVEDDYLGSRGRLVSVPEWQTLEYSIPEFVRISYAGVGESHQLSSQSCFQVRVVPIPFQDSERREPAKRLLAPSPAHQALSHHKPSGDFLRSSVPSRSTGVKPQHSRPPVSL